MKNSHKMFINQQDKNNQPNKNYPVENSQSTFVYTAITPQGNKIHGKIRAKNSLLAHSQLKKQGLGNIRLHAQSTPRYRRAIATKHILITLNTLATLLDAGIVLSTALAISAETCTDARLAAKLTQIKTDIEAGDSFAKAIAQHPEFGKLTLALIDAGEQSGSLDIMLHRAANYAQKQHQLRTQLLQATRYPLAIIITALLVGGILLLKVVPNFAANFAATGDTLPTLTLMVLGLSQWLGRYFWWLIGTGVAMMTLGYWLYQHKPSFRQRIAALSLRLPIIGKLIIAANNAKFTQTLATTLSSGVPLTQSIMLAGKSCDNPLFVQAAEQIAKSVQAGTPLSTAMTTGKLFSPIGIQMIKVGEESGRLEIMLDTVAEFYLKQISTTTQAIISMIEPAIIIVMGVVIGILVLAMYLPIFSMNIGI
ncbi:type II secretion system F family protein [Moraxella cuniculi]|uniref:Cholera toxin secretion protein epsF n=1 Tax=Moraxella cuniculi TaxID=34061 RepID=A0A448GVD1_9GAMM|nr:type II secretion system F family protein [Moraxella cuniculi]VEG12659.1 Cholera toxin secretion protein epsF [Moraxella cuniculi]